MTLNEYSDAKEIIANYGGNFQKTNYEDNLQITQQPAAQQ